MKLKHVLRVLLPSQIISIGRRPRGRLFYGFVRDIPMDIIKQTKNDEVVSILCDFDDDLVIGLGCDDE